MTGKMYSGTSTKQLPAGEYVEPRPDQLYTPGLRDTCIASVPGTSVVRALVTKDAPDRLSVRLNMRVEERGARIAAVNKRLRIR